MQHLIQKVYIPQELKKFDIFFPNEEVPIILHCLNKQVIIGFGNLSSKNNELWVKAEIFSYIPFIESRVIFGVTVEAPEHNNNKVYLSYLRYLVQ